MSIFGKLNCGAVESFCFGYKVSIFVCNHRSHFFKRTDMPVNWTFPEPAPSGVRYNRPAKTRQKRPYSHGCGSVQSTQFKRYLIAVNVLTGNSQLVISPVDFGSERSNDPGRTQNRGNKGNIFYPNRLLSQQCGNDCFHSHVFSTTYCNLTLQWLPPIDNYFFHIFYDLLNSPRSTISGSIATPNFSWTRAFASSINHFTSLARAP